VQPNGEPPLIRSVLPTGGFDQLHDRRLDLQQPPSMPARPGRLFVWGLRVFALAFIGFVLDIGVGLVGGASLLPVVGPIGFGVGFIAVGGWIVYAFGWADLRSRWPWPVIGSEKRSQYWEYSWRATREALLPWLRRR
jgi:hypothetical protein